MAKFNKTSTRIERTRAAGFVLEYEMELAAKLRSNPDARNSADVERVMTRLKTIRCSIMGDMPEMPQVRRTEIGFSQEEIELAEDIIDSLSTPNPFD